MSSTSTGHRAFNPGLVSRLTLWWIGGIVWTGFRKTLQPEDLWPLQKEDEPGGVSKELLRRYYLNPPGKRSMFRATFSLAKVELLLSVFYFLFYAGLRFVGPLLLREIVLFVQEDPVVSPNYYGYLYACGLLASQVIGTYSQAKANFYSFRIGLRIKNALVGATFMHAMALNNSGRQRTTHGQVINLVSTDSQVVVEFMRFINQLWSGPIVLIAGITYIYVLIGPAVFAGVGIIVLFLPFSMLLGKWQTALQGDKMKFTDQRVKQTNEFLQGIKLIKIYAWEDAVQNTLDEVRDVEVAALRKLQYYKAITLPIGITIPNIASVVTFVVYVLLGNELNPSSAFAVVSLFVIIRSPFIIFPLGITMISRILISFRRFNEFFSLPTSKRKLEEVLSQEVSQAIDSNGKALEQDVLLRLNNACFTWKDVSTDESSKTTVKNVATPSGNDKPDTKTIDVPAESDNTIDGLQNISLEVKTGELVAVCGRVAAGKSSICSAILGEMAKVSGTMDFQECKVAYCSQEPFILNATVRENILFGKPYDRERYQRTIVVCALVPDFKLLQAGDQTEIGEKGINLSGGQKARVSLARAVYADADLYVLDDPLSALDAEVGSFIFKHCIGNSETSTLMGKTRILVTNNLHVLQPLGDDHSSGGVDKVVLMEKGQAIAVGHPEQLMEDADSPLSVLMRDIADASQQLDEVTSINRQSSAAASDVSSVKELHNDPNIDTEELERALELGLDAEALGVVIDDEPNDSKHVNEQDQEREEEDEKNEKQRAKGKLTKDEVRSKGKMKLSVLLNYFYSGTGGSPFLVFLLIFLFLAAEASFLSIDSWLAEWSVSDGTRSDHYYISVYLGLTGLFMFLILLRSFGFALFAVEAAKALHEQLLHTVLRLPLPFFWSTPLGRVLNRLTRDVNDIDVILPQSWQWFLMTLARVFGILVVIIRTAPIFAAFLLPMIGIYMLIREFYRRTATELQRIESVQRSPVFNHLGETLGGAPTIRAYKRSEEWIQVAFDRQGQNHRAKFAVEATQIWLALYLEVLGGMVVFTTAMSIVASRETVDPGLAGLAIAYVLNIVINLNVSVRNGTLVEAQMNAIERVMEYASEEIEQDSTRPIDPNSKHTALLKSRAKLVQSEPKVSPDWPTQGAIEFQEVYFKYKAGQDPVLRGLSFRIQPGEHVGLVGRSGAGKSSLLTAIFRLVDVTSGKIVIDDVDVSEISRFELRSRLTFISQEPVLFSGTLRKNLDLFNEYTDAQIWKAIELAHLKDTVSSSPSKLLMDITENADNLSVGERALICLARALLRQTKIVLLDEATAAFDAETDKLVQETVRTDIGNTTTVIQIAHKLDTVMDNDKVMVLHEGVVAEYDTPRKLMEQKGAFYDLVECTGPANAAKLRKMMK